MKAVSEMRGWEVDANYWAAIQGMWSDQEQDAVVIAAQREAWLANNKAHEAEQMWSQTMLEEPPDDVE
jgi:hypothetical protein